MDLSGIISVSGMGGLYKVVTQTRTGLLVESITDGKRFPVYSTTRVSALDDISIYGKQDDIPLKDVLADIMKHLDGKPFDGNVSDSAALKNTFAEIIPAFDDARVYTSDIKKVFVWYNLLLEKNLLTAPDPEEKKDAAPKAEASSKVTKTKTKAQSGAPKASSKGMTKTQTVRKTGA